MKPDASGKVSGYARGFTLVEVLVALVILLAALTVASQAYNASLDYVSRAEAVSGISRRVVEIREQVRAQLAVGEAEGRVEGAGAGPSYAWTAAVAAMAPTLGDYNEFTDEREPGEFQLTLYRVELELTVFDQAGRAQPTRYQYQELVWQRSPLR